MASIRLPLAVAGVVALAVLALAREPLPFATSIRWPNVGFAAFPFAIGALAYAMPGRAYTWCAAAAAAIAAVLFVAASSLVSLASWLLFVAATIGIGLRFLDAQKHRAAYRAVLAHLVGAGAVGLVVSLILSVPIHSPLLYQAALLVIGIVSRRELASLAFQLWEERRSWRDLTQRGERAAIAVAATVGLLSSLGALGAVASYDDLAYHLGLPYELLHNGFYSFDFRHQVWATSPWMSDLVFAIPFMVSGGDEGVHVWGKVTQHFAAGALLYATAREFVSRSAALWIVALWFSTPLALVLTHTQHTESFSALVVIAVFYVWSHPQRDDLRDVATVSLLIGLLASTKASNLILCAALALLFTRRGMDVARMSWDPLESTCRHASLSIL